MEFTVKITNPSKEGLAKLDEMKAVTGQGTNSKAVYEAAIKYLSLLDDYNKLARKYEELELMDGRKQECINDFHASLLKLSNLSDLPF